MSITAISRDWGTEPAIVRLTTTNTLATITTTGYLTTPAIIADIQAIQNGDFEWLDGDMVAIDFADGEGMFTRNSATNSFVAVPAGAGLAATLSSGNIFVGNVSNVATGVAMSGDATMANTGAMTIGNNAITTPKIAAAAVTLAKLAAGIAPSHVVKYAGASAQGGGSATATITVTGMLITDLPFVNIGASSNAVTIQKVTATANTITVLMSGDPGAATVLNYQVLRAAA